MKVKQIFNIGAALVLMLTSCQPDLMDLAPYDRVSSGNMWTTENLSDQGVIGVYNVLRQNYLGNLYHFEALGSSADCRDANDYPLVVGSATTNNGIFGDAWRQHYEGIHRANDAIANLPGAPIADGAKKARLIAESKFLRAYFYYRMNMLYKGVPLYLEPVELNEMVRPRETETRIWEVIIDDLTACINETNFPERYPKGDSDYGRATKAAAYALRGKVYMWLERWNDAVSDFDKVGEAGHTLFMGDYKQLFKEENEQSEEMIFSLQCYPESGYGNTFSFRYGGRVSFEQGWNTYLVNTDFVDSYEVADGSKFNWDDYLPGYSDMTPSERIVFFLRDNLTDAEYTRMQNENGADMSKYLPQGNEERILRAYANRDPRLSKTVITPYSQYHGSWSAIDHTYTLRWPYRGADAAEPYDVRTDTNGRFHYLFRKFVAEGSNEIASRNYSQIDIPYIRYADILLSKAEAINEQGFDRSAVDLVNQVRTRAGAIQLQTTDSSQPTYVSGQADLRERIRNERRWEFAGEGINYFDELRWKTWKESKFFEGAGHKQIWGAVQYRFSWAGDHIYSWPVPRAEADMNPALEQVPGWN